MPPLPFAKIEAHGNDFIVVSDKNVREGAPDLARAMCDRLRGVGGDGLILFRADGARFVMTIINSDGSPAEISGNGLRCLGAYLSHVGLATGPEIEVSTGAGLLKLTALGRNGTMFRFRADMGPPREIAVGIELSVGDETVVVTTLSMGNPHCVVFTERSRLREIGPILESHRNFSDKTNVELVEPIDRRAIHMAIWERGAGETASSGTGSAAAAVASIINEHVESPVQVHCPGGMIEVAWTEGESVIVTGDASVVAEGHYFIDWRTA
ncbi:MAG: diaminopimelate epimerase [Acidobacteria bacterium]|nr:MAG: diaminopimelate epimerase [Acidobacteriota bacterium]